MRATMRNCRPMPVSGKPVATETPASARVTTASDWMARVVTRLSSLSSSCVLDSVISRRMAFRPWVE